MYSLQVPIGFTGSGSKQTSLTRRRPSRLGVDDSMDDILSPGGYTVQLSLAWNYMR